MILTSIKANNVLKYEELTLNLPENGLIAISGPNESGKSTIGETVCFALFGRTFSIAHNEVEKIVRWGENHCSVTLEFQVDGVDYILSRFLDRDGNHSAKLSLAADPDEPVARGVNGVTDKLIEILGFEYDEYVESFYLAQREITTPHPHSHAVKVMAGIEPLETAEEEVKVEIRDRKEIIKDIRAEIDSLERDILALGIKEGHLVELESSSYEAEQQVELVSESVEQVEQGVDVYVANTQAIYNEESKKSRLGFLRFIMLVVAIIFGASWALLTQAPELEQTKLLISSLNENIPQWTDYPQIWLAYIAGGAGVLFLWFWIRAAGVKSRIAALREDSGKLVTVLQNCRSIEVEQNDPEVEEGEELEDEYEESLPSRPAQSDFEKLQRNIAKGEATARQVEEYSKPELAWLQALLAQLQEQMQDKKREIDDEQGRIQESINLHEVIDGLNVRREQIAGRIELRTKALELLKGAIEHMTNHFNRDVKNLVGRMLPLFTDDRYEHLQLAEDLKVRVFSNDKRDFMDLEEVSSGTQRQIMLALRLALSQKLLTRAVKGKQFTFLDEPFAFFDEERTRNALKALTDLGDDISQVWIVAQSFPKAQEKEFSAVIKCTRETDSYTLG